MRISSHGGHHWFGGPPPLTGVIYLSLLSKQPISVRCQPPNGGFYLNKEKWPKSQRRHSNTGHCQISAHTPEIGSLDSPQIFRFGVKFLEILFLWGATSLDSSGPLNDFLNWRKFSWLPHNGLDTGGFSVSYNTHATTTTQHLDVVLNNEHTAVHIFSTTQRQTHNLKQCHRLSFCFIIIWSTHCAIFIIRPRYCAICKLTPPIPSSRPLTPPGTPLTPLDLSWEVQEP